MSVARVAVSVSVGSVWLCRYCRSALKFGGCFCCCESDGEAMVDKGNDAGYVGGEVAGA